MTEANGNTERLQDGDLKKLKRAELLEMMISLSKENGRLRDENAKLRERLDNRKIDIAEAGSIAEASLQVSGIFQAAQEAADCYLENVARLASEQRHRGMSGH